MTNVPNVPINPAGPPNSPGSAGAPKPAGPADPLHPTGATGPSKAARLANPASPSGLPDHPLRADTHGPTNHPASTPLTRPGPGAGPPVRYVAVFLVGLVLFFLIALGNEIRGFTLWRNYALSGILMGAPVVYVLWRFDVRLPAYIQVVGLLGLLLHYVGGSLGSPDGGEGLFGMWGINGAYHMFWWYDHLTHFVGIGATAMGVAYLAEVYQARRGLAWTGPVLWGVAMLAALTAGVFMELYEYLGKTLFLTIDQGGYQNTMNDLHFNVLGALAGATVAVKVNRTSFRQRIRDHWNTDLVPDRPGRFWRRQPSGFVGFVAFLAVPVFVSLVVATKYFFVTLPDPDTALNNPLYDGSLNAMVAGTLVGIAAWPFVTTLHRRALALAVTQHEEPLQTEP